MEGDGIVDYSTVCWLIQKISLGLQEVRRSGKIRCEKPEQSNNNSSNYSNNVLIIFNQIYLTKSINYYYFY